MDNTRKGIAVAGSLIADVFYKIDTYPREGLLTKVRDTKGNVGGTGNMILDLAKMDSELPIEVSALVGNDERGDMLMEKLSEYPNILLDTIQRRGETSVTLVMNADDTKQRTFFFIPAASDAYDRSCIEMEKLNAKIFHLEYLLLMAKVDSPDEKYGTHGARILHDAKEQGMLTSIDIVSEQSSRAVKIVTCALKYTDICAINEFEAESVTGIDLTSSEEAMMKNAEAAARKIHELGVSTWVVIHSPKCSFGYDCIKDEFYAVPSLKLPKDFIVGTNGAGDAFCSGILYTAHQGGSIEDGLKFAAACAACSLSGKNGTDGLRPVAEINKLAEQYKA